MELVETGAHLETFLLFPTYPQSPLLDFFLSPFHDITSFHLFYVSSVPHCFLSDFLDIQGFLLKCGAGENCQFPSLFHIEANR